MGNRIVNKSVVPQGQFNFTVPETGRHFKTHVFGRLILKVQEYQRANNFRVWTEDEIEEDYCKRYPYNCSDGINHAPAEAPAHDDLLTNIAAAVGIPVADTLAKLTSKLGIHCRTCSQRHQVIRRIREIGFGEALRQLKETL